MASDTKTGFGDDESQGPDHEKGLADLASAFPTLNESDPAAVMDRMAKRIHASETIDQLFDSLKGVTSDELVGKSVEVTGVEWSVYESDRGPIPLATVEAVDLTTGEAFEFATTSFMLVHFLRRAQLIGSIPFRARIAGKKTRNNQTALNFERL